jgi:type II secretory pathway component PulF
MLQNIITRQRQNAKRAQIGLGGLPNAVMLIVFAILIGAVALIVLSQFKSSTNGSAEFNETIDLGTQTINNIFSLMPLAGTILILAVIIGLLILAFFWMRNRQGGM